MISNIGTKSYRNVRWLEFAQKIKSRDGFKCMKCRRDDSNAVLQVHHISYRVGQKPWEYPLSDCVTLCKGCHAEIHGKIEPRKGWTLVEINDLGGLEGICERYGCGKEIRYEHVAYHPQGGYISVGSHCIEILTEEDQWKSAQVLKVYNSISRFIQKSIWEPGFTQKGKKFVFTEYKHHQIRIYGDKNSYAFQIAIKEKGINKYQWMKVIPAHNKPLYQVKELAYLVARGSSTESEELRNILREIYRINR